MDENTELSIEELNLTPEQIEGVKLLRKWVWVLFWLIVPTIIGNIMTHSMVVQTFPQMRLPGELLSLLTVVVYGAILVRLYHQQRGFLYAGFCMIVSALIGFGLEYINAAQIPGPWFMVALPADVLSLIAIFYEYHAHSKIMSHFDEEFSRKWDRLWKWYLGIFAGMACGIVVMMISPAIGSMVTMAASLAAAVVTIMKVFYLYQTAQIYRSLDLDE